MYDRGPIHDVRELLSYIFFIVGWLKLPSVNIIRNHDRMTQKINPVPINFTIVITPILNNNNNKNLQVLSPIKRFDLEESAAARVVRYRINGAKIS